MLGNDTFFTKEQTNAGNFNFSTLERLVNHGSLLFNGARLTKNTDVLTPSNPDRTRNISRVDTENGVSPDQAQAKLLNKIIAKAPGSKNEGLRFVLLDLSRIGMAVFIDASFGGNVDLTSDLGFVTVLYDAERN